MNNLNPCLGSSELVKNEEMIETTYTPRIAMEKFTKRRLSHR